MPDRKGRMQPGDKYGKLTLLRKKGRSQGHQIWECECECGNLKNFMGPTIHSSERRGHGWKLACDSCVNKKCLNCGEYFYPHIKTQKYCSDEKCKEDRKKKYYKTLWQRTKPEPRPKKTTRINTDGIRAGNFTVLHDAEKRKKARMLKCLCDCGEIEIVYAEKILKFLRTGIEHNLKCAKCRMRKCIICGGLMPDKGVDKICSDKCRDKYYEENHDVFYRRYAEQKKRRLQRMRDNPDKTELNEFLERQRSKGRRRYREKLRRELSRNINKINKAIKDDE